MKRFLIVVLALGGFTSGAWTLRAQEQTTAGPPKVLVIYREMEKYGKRAGHVKNEAAFAQAFAAAKVPGHFLAVTSMSGHGQAWFLQMFDSYDAIEKENAFEDARPGLQAQMDRLVAQDAEYVSEGTQMVARYNEGWSYHPGVDIAHMRYFVVETIQIRVGHGKDWEDLVSLIKTTSDKAKSTSHVAVFEVTQGAPEGTVLVIFPRKSLAELDNTAQDKAFQDALGEGGQKRLAQLEEAAVASIRVDLFSFSPKMSYVPDDWVKADPAYWKPKAAATPKAAAGSAKKPTAEPAAKP